MTLPTIKTLPPAARRSRAALLPLALLAAVTGCDRSQPKLAPPKPAEVLVSTPISRSITEFEEFTGRTEAVRTVSVRARVTGYLDRVLFKEGAVVDQGDVLFEIDPRTYQADRDKAEAAVGVSEAHLRRLEKEFQRATALVRTTAISQEEFDRIAGDRDEAAAAVRVAKAGLELADLNLSFTKVRSAVTGRISRMMIDPGNLVKADDTMLTTIVTLDPMHASFDMDERTFLRLQRLVQEGKIRSARESSLPVELGLTDEDGYSLAGTIDFVDNKVDPNTGTLRVRGVFPNPKGLLSPGLFVRVRIPVGDAHPAILVAEQALATDQGHKYVYVVNEKNVVSYRRVKVGLLTEGLRVIEDGVAPTDRVVVSGLQRIKPGATVDPKPVEMPVVGLPAAPALAATNVPASGSGAR